MPIEILMPALSPTMTEGNLAKWNVKEGDKIKSGQVIAEIETDKATMEVEAVDEGVMGKILVADGTEGVKVNELIALLLEEGEDAGKLAGYRAKAGGGNAGSGAPVAAPENAPEAAKGEMVPGSGAKAASTGQSADTGVTAGATQTNGGSQAGAASGERVFASPLARRIAGQENISLSGIQGSGPHGRIVKADVEAAKASGGSSTAKATPAISFGQVGRNAQESVEIPLSNMRKVIAKRLLESKQTIPHFYLSLDCDLSSLNAARERMNAAAPKKDGKPAYKLSVNDFMIKASAMALRDVPEANAAWGGDKIIQFNNIDVSVAVAIDGGLITPIVKNAEQKSMRAISAEMKDLAARAREGKLKPEEFQGGSFSLSNLGMYGIKQFNAIINPPQSCILAIGAAEERVVSRGGEFKVVPIMTATLSSDHRVVDGAIGAQFLTAFKAYVEDPVMMVA